MSANLVLAGIPVGVEASDSASLDTISHGRESVASVCVFGLGRPGPAGGPEPAAAKYDVNMVCDCHMIAFFLGSKHSATFLEVGESVSPATGLRWVGGLDSGASARLGPSFGLTFLARYF